MLAKLVRFDLDNMNEYADDAPFYELLHPSFKNATFGPGLARKLVEDFEVWRDRASKVMENIGTAEEASYMNDDAFILTYWWLGNCFAHAMDGGIVRLCRKPD